MNHRWAIAFLATLAFGLTGCGSSSSPTVAKGAAPAAAPAADNEFPTSTNSDHEKGSEALGLQVENGEPPKVADGPEVKVSEGAPAKTEAPAKPVASGANADLVGTWAGKIQLPEKSDDPNAAMARSMAQMLTGRLKLEIQPNLKFTMSMMMPIEGTVKRSGKSLTFAPERMMGMSPEEAQKMGFAGVAPIDAMTATLSGDGKTITFKDKNVPAGGTMVFTRAAPEASRKTTVAAAEKPFVGEWRGTMSGSPAGIDPQQKAQLEQARKVLNSSLALTLRADNTYLMNMMVELEGTWKVDGGKIHLAMAGPGGSPPIVLAPGKDGALTAIQDGQTLKFVRR